MSHQVGTLKPSICFFCVTQGHPEAWSDADGPPEEDHDQRPADESTGPEQECAIGARITPTMRFLSAEIYEPRFLYRSRVTPQETR